MKRDGSKKRRMIVLSLDAVGGRDLPFMKTLPHFGPFFEKAAGCGEVVSVYPSLTYPAHASIVTGQYPKNHGVVNNLQVQPERQPSDWFWQRKYVRGTTLYDEAERHGYRVASLLWPVMGKARVHYNLPEVLPNRPWQNQLSVCMVNGTPLYELDLQMRFGSLRAGIKQPQLDNFVHASMLHTLEKYRPELMLVHLTDVDTNRHLHGLDSAEAMEAIRRHDMRLGELLELLGRLGLEEETDVVLLGDHCQMDVKEAIYPNYYFVKAGLMRVENGRVREWKAAARDCDGCCYIYVKDRSCFGRVERLVRKMMERENSGIARIFTRDQAVSLGADPECAFVLEAEDGYYFQNGWEEYRRKAGASDHHTDFHIQAATHGYLPDRAGYRTFFMAAGPHFAKGARVDRMSLVDEGPTLARILGLDLGDVDGRVMEMLLRDWEQ